VFDEEVAALDSPPPPRAAREYNAPSAIIGHSQRSRLVSISDHAPLSAVAPASQKIATSC